MGTVSHGLELLRIAKVVNPISPSSAMVLRLRRPILQFIHSSRCHDDGSFALGVLRKVESHRRRRTSGRAQRQTLQSRTYMIEGLILK
jgi:hypothetical protein